MDGQILKAIKEKVNKLPITAGVYKMLDRFGNIIYVGKAKNLKRRVSSYFIQTQKPEKVLQMVEHVADFDYILCGNEATALNLESNLIHELQPFYNILLKDGKAFPYIKINMKEDFPFLQVIRRVKKDNCLYFGPYFSKISITDLMKIINDTFMLRDCNLKLVDGKRIKRECLNYHIGKCLAPCVGYVDKLGYRAEINKVIEFLNGDTNFAKNRLLEKMNAYAKLEKFEKSIEIRNTIKILDNIVKQTITELVKPIDIDIFGYATNGKYTAISLIIVRAGRTVGVSNYNVVDASLDECETLTNFITQYYLTNSVIPSNIVVDIDNVNELSSWINNKAGRKIELVSAKIGIKKKLLEMANSNAKEYLNNSITKENIFEMKTIGAINGLKEYLKLSRLPIRIEGYDISHLSGTNIVASMVVFENGLPNKKMYRKFKVDLPNQNDFESMHQVLERRFAELDGKDISFSKLPDLILIDGGKGQLSFANSVVEKSGLDINVISLAKENEEIFKPNISTSFQLNKNDYKLKLLQNVRDESHRFAITFQKSLRKNEMLSSELENIPLLGKEKSKILLKHFKNIENIKNADILELTKCNGIGNVLAKNIFNYFHKN